MHENKIFEILDILRKDPSISNSSDALEQFSLILLMKIYSEKLSSQHSIFCYLIEGIYRNKSSNDRLFIDFCGFLSEEKDEGVFQLGYGREKILEIFNQIPCKIRSANVFLQVCERVESIDIYHDFPKDYSKLIENIAGTSFSGFFYTPKTLSSLVVNVLSPASEQSIYDPAMGAGSFLVESVKYTGSKFSNIKGNDVSISAYLIGVVNLLLNGISVDNVFLKDSLQDYSHDRYDIILSNPPLGKSNSTSKIVSGEYYDLPTYEAKFLKHAMLKLKESGKAAFIVPEGFLYTGGTEIQSLRRELLTFFNLHTIVKLPAGSLIYAGVKVVMIFFENKKPSDNIWVYKLNREKTVSKRSPLENSDFNDFYNCFYDRLESENSFFIKRDDALNDENCRILIEKRFLNDEVDEYDSSKDLEFVVKESSSYGELISDFKKLSENKPEFSFEKEYKLGEILRFGSGKMLVKDDMSGEGEFPVYGGNGIIGYYNEPNANQYEEGVIIIGRVGMHCGNIHYTNKKIWITNNSFYAEAVSDTIVHLPYVSYVLKDLNLNKLARGTAQGSITISKIKDLTINLPSLSDQKKLSEYFDQLANYEDKMNSALENQKNKITEIKEGLIRSATLKNIRK